VAFRTKRRRRPRVAWLPTNIIANGEAPASFDAGGVQGILNLDDAGDIVYDAFPLTFDASKDPSNFDPGVDAAWERPSLQDYVTGNQYRLRRIVGKCFIFGSADELDDPPDFPALIDVAAGFIVCKTDDDGAPLTNFTEVNPLAANSMNDPWIWRRRWVLNPFGHYNPTNIVGDLRANPAFADFPGSTAGYGSAVDGPHIDQKTARNIDSQERLFAVLAARGWSNDYAAFGALRIDYLLDYRILASLRTASVGNRGNASR